MSEISVGNICTNEWGLLGIITIVDRYFVERLGPGPHLPSTIRYRGIGFDGTPWTSADPMLEAANMDEYLDVED